MTEVHVKSKAEYSAQNQILCYEGKLCEVLAEEPNGGLRIRFGREARSVSASDLAQYFEVIPGSYIGILDGNAVFTLAAEKCVEFFVRRKLVQVPVSALAPQIREALVRQYLDLLGYRIGEPLNYKCLVFGDYPQEWIMPVFEKYGLSYKEMTINGDSLRLGLSPAGCTLEEFSHYNV